MLILIYPLEFLFLPSILRHWSLAKLGDQLPLWIEKYYTAQDKSLILAAAELIGRFKNCFLLNSQLTKSTLDLLSKKCNLQKHVKLFALPFDLCSFRTQLLKEKVEFWTTSNFPPLSKEKKYFFVLYRNVHNGVTYKEIGEGEWTLLHLIEDGFTIEEACEHLEKKGGSLDEEAGSSLQKWTQEWMRQKWLISIT